MTSDPLRITAAIVIGSLSAIGLVHCLTACGSGVTPRGASYAVELQACVHRADSAAESDACAAEVRRRYGREAGAP